METTLLHLNGLVVVVIFLLLEFLLKEGVCLSLLGPDRAGLTEIVFELNR